MPLGVPSSAEPSRKMVLLLLSTTVVLLLLLLLSTTTTAATTTTTAAAATTTTHTSTAITSIWKSTKIKKFKNWTDLGWFGGDFGMVWEQFRDDFGPILKIQQFESSELKK